MNLGFRIVKEFETNIPETRTVYDAERGVVEKPTGRVKKLCIRDTDKVTKKAPNMGHYKVYEDEKVDVYQRNGTLRRVFVIK
jgi:hypothetical protein